MFNKKIDKSDVYVYKPIYNQYLDYKWAYRQYLNYKKNYRKKLYKEGYEKAVKESEQALKDARKAGNKYTKSQARKQFDNLRKKINSTNTSLKHFKEVEPELLEKK